MVRAQFFVELFQWLGDERYTIPIPKPDATAGRIDLARSNLFEWAKKLEPDVHYQIDTDVALLQPMHEMTELVLEDFVMGWDIVIGPTAAYNNRAMTWGFEEKPHPHGPIKIKHGAFGFVAFSPRILEGLKPLSHITNVAHERLPLYCLSTEQTEDNSFCDNATSQGFRVCCDYRLHVAHIKELAIAPCLPGQTAELRTRFPGIQWVEQNIILANTPDAPAPEIPA